MQLFIYLVYFKEGPFIRSQALKVMLLLIGCYHIKLPILHAHLGSYCPFLFFTEFKLYARSHFQSFFHWSVWYLTHLELKEYLPLSYQKNKKHYNHINLSWFPTKIICLTNLLRNIQSFHLWSTKKLNLVLF